MKTKPKNGIAAQPAEPQSVVIEFQDEEAHEVCIAGTFNDWRPAASPMISIAPGKWKKQLALPPGRHEYRLVVDGQWRTDPGAAQQIPNGLGEFNSVIEVELPDPRPPGENP